MSLSLRITISRARMRAGVVHGLVGHAGAHRPVADHATTLRSTPVEPGRHRHAEPGRDRGRAVRGAERVVVALRAPGEAGEPARLAQGADARRAGRSGSCAGRPGGRRPRSAGRAACRTRSAAPRSARPRPARRRDARRSPRPRRSSPGAARPPAAPGCSRGRRRRSLGSWIWSRSGRRRHRRSDSLAERLYDLRLITKSNSSRQDACRARPKMSRLARRARRAARPASPRPRRRRGGRRRWPCRPPRRGRHPCR